MIFNTKKLQEMPNIYWKSNFYANSNKNKQNPRKIMAKNHYIWYFVRKKGQFFSFYYFEPNETLTFELFFMLKNNKNLVKN